MIKFIFENLRHCQARDALSLSKGSNLKQKLYIRLLRLKASQ